MKDNLVAIGSSSVGPKEAERTSFSSKKVIDMEIIDRIKNMRSKSRDNKQQ
jgi:hypothetical protein